MTFSFVSELLTVCEAAARLKLKPTTIRRWLRFGESHGFKLEVRHQVCGDEFEPLLGADQGLQASTVTVASTVVLTAT